MRWICSRALLRVRQLLFIASWIVLPQAQAQDAQACSQSADSCETACAVAALTNALLSKGKSDGNRENAECAARCQATKNQCLAGLQSRPAAPAAPIQPAPAVASGPSVAECQERITSIHRQSDAEFQRHRNDPLAGSRVLYESNRAQRTLFAGDCASHPNAAGYVAGAEQGMREWSGKCVQFGGTPECGGTAPIAQPSHSTAGSTPAPSPSPANQHDPAGVANHCIRANTEESYGGFTNTCNFAVSYLHCFYRPQQDRHDTQFFNCERPGGLWAKSTTAGNLRPGQRNGTGIPIGGRIFVIACREPYGIRNASFDGTTLRASCVAGGGGSPSQTTGYSPPPSAPAPAAPRPQPQAPAGQDMAHCMKLERSSSGGASLANHCGVTVEATWCTEGGNAGDDCSRGFRNQWTIGAGRSYPVQGRPTRVRWGACRGANNLRGTGELLKYRCVG